MKTSEFDFNLPERLIAQHPLKSRDQSRLFVDKKARTFEHKHFFDIIDELCSNDCLEQSINDIFLVIRCLWDRQFLTRPYGL